METNTALMNDALRKLLEAIAGREGIKVNFDQTCTTPHASADKVITMPPPSAVESKMYWVYAYHELGHLMKGMRWTYTNLQRVINMDDPLVRGVANILVDNFQERNLYGRYEGVDAMQDWGRAWVLEDWFDEPAKVRQGQSDPALALIYGLILVDAEHRQTWAGHLVEAFDTEGKTEGFEEVVEALKGINVLGRIEAIGSSVSSDSKKADATKVLIEDILKLIGYEPPPPEPQGNEGQGQGDGEGDQECEACGGSGEGEGEDGECESCGGTGKEGGDNGGQDGQQHSEGNQQDLAESDPMYNPDGMGTGAGGNGIEQVGDVDSAGYQAILKALGKGIDEVMKQQPERHQLRSNWQAGAAGYVPYAKTNEKNLEKDASNPGRGHYHSIIKEALGNSTVSKQISKYLKAMSTESYTYGQRSGKIHQKNLYKLTGGRPTPGVQPGIFKRKNSSVLKTDSAVTILMDCSGSMSGSKYGIAAACCVALNETLTGLRVPHEILGFTEDYVPTHYIFKSYGTTMTKDKMLNVVASKNVRMGCNADGESLLWAAQRLAVRQEKRKLLIVLSDGMPAGGYDGDGDAYLKHVCNMIETESNMDLVGVGIRTTAPRKFYKHHEILHDASKLDEVLFTLLKNFLV